MQTLTQDVRYAVRQLRKSPGFTLVAVLTLALGIGATTAMFSVVYSQLMAPLPYPEQQQLMSIEWGTLAHSARNGITGQGADFITAHARSFAAVGIFDDTASGANFSVTSAGGSARPEQVHVVRVSHDFFRMLGVGPVIGREFTAAEDNKGATPVVVLSNGLWRRALHSDPGVVGHVVRINEQDYTVVGITAENFQAYPVADVWLPLQLGPQDPGYDGTNYGMIGRLNPGVSLQQAQQEMNVLYQDFLLAFPNTAKDYARWEAKQNISMTFALASYRDALVVGIRNSLVTLMGAVVLVLLIACLNLAGLLVARSQTRVREIALRTALGAGRTAIVRMLLVESLMLAVAGGALGLVFSYAVVPVMLTAAPMEIPRAGEGGVQWIAALFALGAACATTLVFGWIPALGVFRQDARAAMAQGGNQTAGAARGTVRVGRWLMVAQTAFSVMLLTGAALLLGGFLKLRSTPPGFEAKQLYVFQASLTGSKYDTATGTNRFVYPVLERLRHMPGVGEAAAVIGLPLDRGLNDGGGPSGHPELMNNIEVRTVSESYMHAMDVSVLTGREFAQTDSATSDPVAIINETAAKKWSRQAWKGDSPLNHSVMLDANDKHPMRVIGVVADVHDSDMVSVTRPTIYLPFTQASDGLAKMDNHWFLTTFVLRVHGRPELAGQIASAVAEVDPEIPVAKFAPMQSFIDKSVAEPRFYAWLMGSFSGFALLLTVIGLFGLLSYQVSQRTREIGVRMALGAQRGDMTRMFMRKGLVLAAIGLAIGGVGAYGVQRVVASLVEGVPLNGVAAVAGVSALLMAAAALASYLPARRAAKIEPMEALRVE